MISREAGIVGGKVESSRLCSLEVASLTKALATHFDRFVFLVDGDPGNASLRIHYFALQAALEAVEDVAVVSLLSGEPVGSVDKRTALIFYYNDPTGIADIRARGLAQRCGLALCFGSDIRRMSQYNSLTDIVDCFIMPSEHHQAILELNTTVPVRKVREGIDPLADDMPSNKRENADCSIAWFGYPESYYRGMRYFEPVIQLKQREGKIDRFALITDRRLIDPRAAGAEIIAFDPKTFGAALSSFTYAILSHAPGDLQVNSLIKSPNKVITALAAGLVPIATATPNYASLLEELGLQQYLFRSPRALADMLDRLDPQRDLETVRSARPRERLEDILSHQNILDDFARIIVEIGPRVEEIRAFTRTVGVARPFDDSFLQFKESLGEVRFSMERALLMRARAVQRRWDRKPLP